MKRYLPLGLLLVLVASLRGGAQLPQLTCCSTGGSGGGGDASGPASSTDEAISRFDGTTGKLLQNGSVTLSDTTGVFTQGTANTGFTFTPNGTGIVSIGSGYFGLAASAGVVSTGVRWLKATSDASGPFDWLYFQPISNGAAGSVVGQWKGSYCFTQSTNAENGWDTCLSRKAAGVFSLDTTNANAGDNGNRGGWQQWAGECYVASDATNATATMASSTCSISVTSGRKYAFKCILMQSDSVAAEGASIDFAGGTAGETYFRAQVTAFDSALNLSTQVDDITDTATASTFTGAGTFEVHGAFQPSSTGTFIPRFSQASHVTGTLTLFQGSHCLMWDAP